LTRDLAPPANVLRFAKQMSLTIASRRSSELTVKTLTLNSGVRACGRSVVLSNSKSLRRRFINREREVQWFLDDQPQA
jgi:hypothetical protein